MTDAMTRALDAWRAGRKDIYALAREFGVSASGLYRAIKREIGEAPKCE